MNLDFSKTPMASWDVDMSCCGHRSQVELKYRNEPSTAYDSWLLEVKKRELLQERIEQNANLESTLYVNFTSDFRQLVWKLEEIDFSSLPVIEKWCPTTTAEDNGHELKEVFLLPQSEAVIDTAVRGL